MLRQSCPQHKQALAFLGQLVQGSHATGADIQRAHLAINLDATMLDI